MRGDPSVEDLGGGSELLGFAVVPCRTEGQAHRRQNSYLHGIVEALCKVAVEVPGAFHWQTGKVC